jgi:hypothetical protein
VLNKYNFGGDDIKFASKLSGRLGNVFGNSKLIGTKKTKIKTATRKTRQIDRRYARWLMVALLGFLILSGPISFLRSLNVSHENLKLKTQINSYQKQLDSAKSGTTAYNPLLGQFMTGFVNAYMNFDSNSDADSKRKATLTPMFAKNISLSQLTSAGDGQSQSLKSVKLTALYVQGGTKTAQMQVDYVVKKDGTSLTQSGYLNVPYGSKNGKFTVVAMPFMSDAENPVGRISRALVRNTKQSTLSNTETVTSVTKFVDSFMSKYASSKPADMKFVMNNPVGLGGKYDYLQASDLVVSGSKSHPVVSGTIRLRLAGTSIEHSEQFELHLIKQNSTYFVESFTH